MAPQELPPPLALLRMVTGYYVSCAIHVAAKLSIADLMSEGPRGCGILKALIAWKRGTAYDVYFRDLLHANFGQRAMAAQAKIEALRLAKRLTGDNPIFLDELYLRCFYASLDSMCEKMKFGCVIVHRAKVVYEGCNEIIDALHSICKPRCIRLSITPRTESMLGACGHAEEGLWHVIHRGIPIHECELYVAGIYPTGQPWLKSEAEHTCLRCALQMHNAKIKRIYVPVVNHWEGLTTIRAVETALAYATQRKKVNTG
jgi:deoxycytidylate deaminase